MELIYVKNRKSVWSYFDFLCKNDKKYKCVFYIHKTTTRTQETPVDSLKYHTKVSSDLMREIIKKHPDHCLTQKQIDAYRIKKRIKNFLYKRVTA